ncbi:uncharacterized protein LOC135111092 isoform X1 [Scylla paramamosain]|uniref:uncharacterized protein LOC135111092 isoform X1 n=1 Tax=Scylla paramamosain TaxID=85552 RepID=UPI003082754D
MADLPEHKDGGDNGKPDTAVALKEGSSELQCTSSGVCGDDLHQSKGSTLLQSSKLHQNECGSVSVHSLEAEGRKSSEEAADNPGKLVLEDGSDGSEARENFKKLDDMACSFDESKLAKTSVSQAKDPPDKENDQGVGKLISSEQNESPPQEDATNEIQAVSTKSSETTVSLNNSTSGHPPPCTPPMSEAAHTGDELKEANASTETVVPSTPGCQESLTSLSKPTSLSAVKLSDLDLDLSSFVSSDHQEKLTEALVESQGSSKSSINFESVEPTGVEGSSTRSSSISSTSDLCSASEVEHTVIDAIPQSYSVTSAPTQISSVQQELGNKMALLVNQSQFKKTEAHSQTSKTQCPQESICAENKRQDKVGDEKDGAIIEQEKNCMGNEVPDNSGIVTGQSEMNVERNESCNDVSLMSEAGIGTLPLIVATRSLSQEQDAEMSTEKREQTALASTETNATNKKIVPLLESEPLKPVTIGSSLQPLELIQEASMVEDTPITTDMAIIDSSADEADSIGGLVINNVIGAADGVVDFHPDDVETEKELTDISASAPQLGEGSDSSDEHGPSAKRRRLENGPNGVEDKSNSAKRVIFKVIPVKNGHGVWDSQKLQEVLLAKGTILLQIHASKESMELFEAEKDEKKVDFTAIMTETKDDDHDQMSFGNVEPEGDDPLAVATSHPSFSRPFSHSHRRSTALQPAMSRPGFKHLQTPQEYHMKNEVLGLPPPLEFEEPQMGNPDWSGFGLNSKPTNQQNTHLSLGTIPSQIQTIQPRVHTVKVTKVCKVCGVILNTPAEVAKHQHCMLWKCGKCQFQTKTLATFNEHLKLHQMKHNCTLCHEIFSSPITHAVHRRKIHGLYDCKYCFHEFTSKTEWSNHIKLNHKDRNKKDVKNLTPPSNEGPFGNEMLLPKFPILVPGPPAGIIISTSESINTICRTNMQPTPVVYNPQLYNHGNPAEKQPLTPNNAEGITCKEEPLETENNNPGTVLIKLKPKRRRKSTSTSKVVGLPCESCSSVFKTLTALRFHIKQKHTERPKCPACNITRSTSRKIFQHQITAHKEKFRCRHYCLALFDTREELSAHHISVHNKDDTVMKCRHCGMKYAKGTYVEHLQECLGEIKCKRVKTCPTCDRKFVDSTEYNHHVRVCESSSAKDDGESESPAASTSADYNQGEQQNYTNQLEPHKLLEESSQSSEENHKLEEVNSSQPKTNQFKCRFCPKVFQCKEDGVDHMVNQHNTAFSCMKEYRVCDICGKLFISGLSLCKHVLRHYERGGMWNEILPANFGLEDIKVKCWICKTSGVSFSTFHTRSRNSVIENLLSGKTCKSSVTDEDYIFQCHLCEETFSDIHKFWNHIKIHLSTPSMENVEEHKPFLCPKCPQNYAVQSELLEHLALHLIQQNISGDKLEKTASNNMFADSCDKMDEDLNEEESLDESDSTKLKTDVSDDSGMTYKCLYCEQVFSIKSDASKHLLSTHVDDLNIMINGKACHLCDQFFIKAYALCSHILKHYIDLGKWEDMVPRNLLNNVNKRFCWICKTVLKTGRSGHMTRRNNTIEEALSCRSEELEEDEQFQCPLCEFSCSNRYSHWKHIKLHLFLNRRSLSHVDANLEVEQSTVSQDSENKKFNCLKCNKQFSEVLSFRRHLACHFLRPFKIRKRKRNESDSDDKQVNKKRKTMTLRSKSLRSNSGRIRCTRCFMTFEGANEGVSHVLHAHKFKMTHVKEQGLTCKMCGAKFKGEWWLCRHLVNHYCTLEMWNDLVPRDLVNALNTRNQCWICKCVLDKNYVGHTSKRNAYIGMLLTGHCKEEESKFDCSLCNKEFSTRIEFWQHMKLHLSKPPSDYTPQSDLMAKEKREDYECSDCSLHFKSEDELYKHLAFHFLEYTNKGKSGTDIMVEDHQSEETVQTEESSEDDEWLPPSIVKKRKTENKKQEDEVESNVSVIKIEDHEILEDISEITIKSEDIIIDEM